MSINKDLNVAPYFDDYDIEKKYYRVLFKPEYSVQARELTQLQTILQNQIEQFGDNIYKEGSIIQGCTFSELDNLKYVKVDDDIDPTLYVDKVETVDDTTFIEYTYKLRNSSGLKARIVEADFGFKSRAPNLNTFYISYLNTSNQDEKQFSNGEALTIVEYKTIIQIIDGVEVPSDPEIDDVASTTVATFSNPIGESFGVRASEGIIFQKGHFLFADPQIVIVTKYQTGNNSSDNFLQPHNKVVGYIVDESIVNAQQDESLFDNANDSPNENAPGADRLKLKPRLVAREVDSANEDGSLFILIRYEDGQQIKIRDVSQFNSIKKHISHREAETHGNYVVKPFNFETRRIGDILYAVASPGIAYVDGYRVENTADRFFEIDEIDTSITKQDEPVSFNYGGYCKVVSNDGNVVINDYQTVTLQNGSENNIGTAIATNYTEDKIFLFAIRMNGPNNNYNNVRYVIGSSGRVEIEPKIRDANKSSLVFDTGMYAIKSINNMTFNIRKYKTAVPINGSGEMVISREPDESFNDYSLKDILVINNDNQKLNITQSEVTNENELELTVNDANTEATVYYNVQISPNNAKTKQPLSVYVKTQIVAEDNKYTLGLPDCFELLEVTGSDGTDYTESFKLVKNQEENFYDHSYIEHVDGRPIPGVNEEITVKVKVFKVDFSTERNFFTVNSYTGVDVYEIPTLETSDGRLLDLRTCIDLRPQRKPIANYAEEASSATQLSSNSIALPPSNEELFDSGINYMIPALHTSGNVNIEYFVNRTDLIVIDSHGRFTLMPGKESEQSNAPKLNDSVTPIAELFIPGSPVLSQKEANELNRKSYAVSISSKISTPNYTMKDIDRMNRRISRLMYYTSISQLESSARNLSIQDADGLNRFKNGIMADSFQDLSRANVNDSDFSASLDTSRHILNPAVRTIPLKVDIENINNITTFGQDNNIATLSIGNPVNFLSQTHATNYRTATSNVYEFRGDGYLYPPYDFGYDTTTTPVNIDIDLETPISDLVDNLQEFLPMTETSSEVIDFQSNNSINSRTFGRTTETTTTTTNETTRLIEEIRRSFNIEGGRKEQKVGDFVTNFEFKPYMRPSFLRIEMHGLRPNTRHYFFFDGEDVNEDIRPARIKERGPNASANERNRGIFPDGRKGEPVETDAFGTLYAVFRIPENTFLIGERILKIADVPTYEDIGSAASSTGKISYNAYNFDIDKASTTVTTRYPEIDVNTTTTERSVTERNVAERTTRRTRPRPAISESCFVEGTLVTMADGSHKKIEEVLIGEQLLGQDNSINNVLEYDHPMLNGRDLIGLNNNGPFMTPEHPLYTKEGWKSYSIEATLTAYPYLEDIMVGELQIGDEILKDDGTWIALDSIERYVDCNDQRVYNFYLDGNNTYFADNLLAHNRGGPSSGSQGAGGGRDNCPIAQTFFIKDVMAKNGECLFLHSLDVFFKRKSTERGVTIQIREVQNGYPAWEILPFGKVHLTPSEVNVSDDASRATTVTFEAPVRLDSEKEYCFVIKPDQDDPEYLVFTMKVGGTDLRTGNPVTQDWGDGVLFTSTNDRAWKSYQDENIKVNFYRYHFNVNSGSVTIETQQNDFFTIKDNIGRFSNSEMVYALKQDTNPISINLERGSDEITGSDFDTFSVGDYIYVKNNNDVVDLLKVSDVVDNENIIIEGFATFNGTFDGYRAVAGEVMYFNRKYPNILMLENSSARPGRRFRPDDTIWGLESGAEAIIDTVDDIEFSYMQTMINRTNDSSTNVTASAILHDPENPGDTPYETSIQFDDKKKFNERGCFVRSISNVTQSSMKANIKVKLDLFSNNNGISSPFIDLETASLFGYIYKIGNTKKTSSKYITKKVELAEGFDAEDFKIFLTAYRPVGTDIKSYIKLRNQSDPSSFDSNDWIEMELVDGDELFSSTSNLRNYYEYAFEIPDSFKNAEGIVEYSNDNGKFIGYKSFALKIELYSDKVNSVPNLRDFRGIAFE